MSDTIQTIGAPAAEHDLDVRVESFEVTPALVAASLSFGGSEVPEEMMSAVERIWQDDDFTWPTTLAVTAISVSSGDASAADSDKQVARVSIVGTGFEPDRPVSLSWTNAAGFPGGSVQLADAKAGPKGFFGAHVSITTAPRRAADYAAEGTGQLTLVAQQSDDSGTARHTAEQASLPAHALWHWVR